MKKTENRRKLENRYFVIMCYKRLHRQGRISGRGIERHNELVKEYASELSDYTSSKIKPIPITKSVRRKIKINREKFLIRQKYERLVAEMIDHYPDACISRHNSRVVERYGFMWCANRR